MFRCLVFDLDDTLLDTWHLLVPRAAQSVCSAMVTAGLNCTVSECLDEREQYLHRQPRGNAYTHLVQTFGLRPEAPSKDELVRLGQQAYHQFEVPEDLKLIEGVATMLAHLRPRYHLHLVTSGRPDIQQKKMATLNLANQFERIWIVNPYQGQTKQNAFIQILQTEKCAPQELLCIGNRLDLEIKEAKQLGCKTCYVQYGEYASDRPSASDEQPDFQLMHITDLITICQL